MVAFAQARKRDSRTRLLNAAATLFREQGYLSVSVDDVAAASGISRVTFYRHFANKAVLAIALFKQVADAGLPRYVALRDGNFRDRGTIHKWLADIFAADRENRCLLQVFIQANVTEDGFTQTGHEFIGDIIVGLGQKITAFAVSPATPAGHRRWVEAWLLVYEILDQSNHAARGTGIAPAALMVEILTEKFLRFVNTAG